MPFKLRRTIEKKKPDKFIDSGNLEESGRRDRDKKPLNEQENIPTK